MKHTIVSITFVLMLSFSLSACSEKTTPPEDQSVNLNIKVNDQKTTGTQDVNIGVEVKNDQAE